MLKNKMVQYLAFVLAAMIFMPNFGMTKAAELTRTELYKENFDGFPVGTAIARTTAPGYAAATNASVVNKGGSHTRALELKNSARLLRAVDQAPVGKMQVSFDFMQETKTAIDCIYRVTDANAKVTFLLKSDGTDIQIHYNAATPNDLSEVVVPNYTAGQWYSFVVEVDSVSQTTMIAVDGHQKLFDKNLKFMYGVTSFARVFDTQSTTTGTYYLDNILAESVSYGEDASVLPENSEIVFEENFNSVETGQVPGASSYGYTVASNVKTVNIMGRSKALAVTSTGSNTGRLLKTYEPYQTQKLTVSFDFMQEEKSTIDYICAVANDLGNRLAFQLKSNGTDIVLWHSKPIPNSGDANPEYPLSNVVIANYVPGTWYSVQIEVDYDSKALKIWVDGERILEGTELKFMYDMPNLGRVFDTRIVTAGSYYLDNLLVYRDSIPADYVIDGASYLTASGAATLTPAAGGKVDKLYLTKNVASQKETLITAVYSEGVLNFVQFTDLSASPVGKVEVPLNLSLPASPVVKAFLVDSTENIKPLAKGFASDYPENGVKTIYLAGDSTVADYEDINYPQAGWGQLIKQYLDPSKVQVVNRAERGRSSKSFIREGRLDKIIQEIKPGDYLFVQFAHNDQKGDVASHTDPGTTYKDYLRQYVNKARQKQASVVFVTSPVRLSYDANNNFNGDNTVVVGDQTLNDYAQAMKEVAAELTVPVVDLLSKSKELIISKGRDYAEQNIYLYLAVQDPRFMADSRYNDPNNNYYKLTAPLADSTHFQATGADEMAKLVLQGLQALNHSLANSITGLE